jgi:cell division protein ZipA
VEIIARRRAIRIIGAMSENAMRIYLLLIGLAVVAMIYWFGRPKREGQGRRDPSFDPDQPQNRREPVINTDEFHSQNDPDAEFGAEVGNALTQVGNPPIPTHEHVGARPETGFDLLISLHVMVPQGGMISGSELIVAAEKASLVYGAQGLFHRLVDGRPAAGPIFSMVNRMEPGRFELSRIHDLQTPGVSLFMTLPGALSGLDAWDKMLPAAQRLAGLLNADVYDDQMHLLGRQRIASIRDELRAYDRKHEVQRGRI